MTGGIRLGYGNPDERCWVGALGELDITAVILGIREDAVEDAVKSAFALARALEVERGRVLVVDVNTATVRVVPKA